MPAFRPIGSRAEEEAEGEGAAISLICLCWRRPSEDVLAKVTMAVGSERLSAVKVNLWIVEEGFGLGFYNRLLVTRPLPDIVISLDILGVGVCRV